MLVLCGIEERVDEVGVFIMEGERRRRDRVGLSAVAHDGGQRCVCLLWGSTVSGYRFWIWTRTLWGSTLWGSTLGVYCLGLPILHLDAPTLAVYPLGVYTLGGVCLVHLLLLQAAHTHSRSLPPEALYW